MLLPHSDGSVEKIDVDEMRPSGDRWVVAQDERLGVRWLHPQPPVRNYETGYLVAERETIRA
jgi:hypothetical protein